MFENERPTKKDRRRGGYLERKRTSLWLVNQISKELKTPGLFHARIIVPVCNPVRPSSTPVHPRPFSPPFPKRNEAEKRAVRPFPPDLGIFSSFFALFFSLSSHPLPRYRVPDKKMAGRLESSFLKNARTCLRAHRTYTIDDHTPTRAQFPLLVGESISEDLENA